MATTALAVVNAVLRRLRETQVTTFSASYTLLILDFVNEAKREVEDAWTWTHLRSTKSLDTVGGTQTYTLTGYGDRFKMYDRKKRLFDSTNKSYLYPLSGDKIEEYKWTTTSSNALPIYYRLIGDVSGDPTIELWPIPADVYALKVPVYIPQIDLVSITDSMTVPSLPVIMGAWARAISERGEDQGFKTTDQYLLYKDVLADFIAMDAAHVDDETTWEAV